MTLNLISNYLYDYSTSQVEKACQELSSDIMDTPADSPAHIHYLQAQKVFFAAELIDDTLGVRPRNVYNVLSIAVKQEGRQKEEPVLVEDIVEYIAKHKAKILEIKRNIEYFQDIAKVAENILYRKRKTNITSEVLRKADTLAKKVFQLDKTEATEDIVPSLGDLSELGLLLVIYSELKKEIQDTDTKENIYEVINTVLKQTSYMLSDKEVDIAIAKNNKIIQSIIETINR